MLIRRPSRRCCAGPRRSTTSGVRRPATVDGRQADQGGRQGRHVVRLRQPRRAVFDDPYKLDVTRTNVDHMTFGKGSPHLCLGNNLARMEIRLMFEELLPRLTASSSAGDVPACAATSSTASRGSR